MTGVSLSCPACGILGVSDLGPVAIDAGLIRLADAGRILS